MAFHRCMLVVCLLDCRSLYHWSLSYGHFVYFTVSLSYQVVPCLLYCALAVVRSFVVIIHPLILRGHHSCQAVWNVLSDSPIVELPLHCPLDAPWCHFLDSNLYGHRFHTLCVISKLSSLLSIVLSDLLFYVFSCLNALPFIHIILFSLICHPCYMMTCLGSCYVACSFAGNTEIIQPSCL